MAEKFQCGKTQVQSILLKKDEIIEDYEANVSTSIKRLRTAQHEDIDSALLDWFRNARSKNILVTARKSYKNRRSSRDFSRKIQGLKWMARPF